MSGRLQAPQTSLYISEILKFNNMLALVSKKKPEAVLAKLIRQSVSMWDFLADKAPAIGELKGIKALDIGSGAGFPGMIWKLLNPALSLTVVERKTGKAFFIERTVLLMGLRGVRVIEKDARSLEDGWSHEKEYDVATMLAVAPPEEFSSTATWPERPWSTR